MTPIEAGTMLAPLFIAMDLFALRYWEAVDLVEARPLAAASGAIRRHRARFFVLRDLDRRAIEIVMAVVTLTFAMLWFRGGAAVAVRPRSPVAAIMAGGASGVTTMVAHSGGPPLAMYLLPLGLSKQIYAGTTSLFFHRRKSYQGRPLARDRTAVVDLVRHDACSACRCRRGRLDRLATASAARPGSALPRVLRPAVVTALKLLWDGASGYFG
jgi:hypothetical protein